MRILLWLLILSGCEGVVPAIDWQQMIDQHKAQPFEASPFFADGRAMQAPPEHSVPRDRVLGDPALTDGIEGGKFVDTSPLPPTSALLAVGRARFETFCAACHGLDGSGRSEVARSMERRKPPSLLAADVVEAPAGRIFQIVTQGYGLMPRFSWELTPRERWAVVAWLRVLQLASSVEVDRLPPAQRDAMRAALDEVSP
jgi:mono/diheme cytochrome c family protein